MSIPRTVGVAGFLLMCSSLQAASISVTSPGSTYDLTPPCSTAVISDLPGPDGETSLIEAICAANNTAGADVITLSVDVVLTEPFAGSTTVGGGVAGTPDIDSVITIDGNRRIERPDPAPPFRILQVTADGSLTLNQVTIDNGYIFGGPPDGGATALGGGIHVASGGSLTVQDSRFENNGSAGKIKTTTDLTESPANAAYGGAIANFGTATITGTTFQHNFAQGGPAFSLFGISGTGKGGAIFNGGTLTVNGSTFDQNNAFGGDGIPTGLPAAGNRAGPAHGSAIFNDSGATLSVGGSTFTFNESVGGSTNQYVAGISTGGGIHNEGTILSIAGSLFEENRAKPGYSFVAGNCFGAAIYNGKTGVINAITSTTFLKNWARMHEVPHPMGGGFILFSVGDILISGWDELETLGGNNFGGAIFNAGRIDLISGGEFVENEARGVDGAFGSGAGSGGAIANYDKAVIDRITGVTFRGNRARSGNAGGSASDGLGAAIFNNAGGTINEISTCEFLDHWTEGGDGIPTPGKPTVFKGILTVLGGGGNAEGGAIYNSRAVPSGIAVGFPEVPQAHIGTIADSVFRNNLADGGGGVNAGSAHGGAIYNGGKLDLITNSTFENNHARGQFGLIVSKGRGGAIYVAGGRSFNILDLQSVVHAPGAAPMAITDSTFRKNKAEGGDGLTFDGDAEGGAIYNGDATVTLTRLQIRENTAHGGDAQTGFGNARGSAIYNFSGPLTILDSEIVKNFSFAGGAVKGGDASGAVRTGGDTVITRTNIEFNETFAGTGLAGGESRGGGIHFAAGGDQKLTLTNVTLHANLLRGGKGLGNCSGKGGGLFVENGTADVRNSTFAYNFAGGGGGNGCDGEGGAVYSRWTRLKIVNSTITGNRAHGVDGLDAGDGRGGGIFVDKGITGVYNSTVIVNNVRHGSGLGAFQDGGGTFVGSSNALLLLFSTILMGNTHGESSPDNCFGFHFSLDYNLIGPGACLPMAGNTGNNRSGPSPLLSVIANNGGPPSPFFPTFTHALNSGSSAINTGNCAVTHSDAHFSNSVTTDQRGAARGAPCDIGAFEFGATITVFPDPVFGATPSPGSLSITGATGASASQTITVRNHGGAGTGLDLALVSLSAGYGVTGLPLSGLGSGASAELTVSCTVGTPPAGSLVLATNENPAAQYTWNLTCISPAATAPVYDSDPLPGSGLLFTALANQTSLTISNSGPAGTLLNVTDISSHPGFTIVSGLPIAGLASGGSVNVVVESNDGSGGIIILQTNEPGNPTYRYGLTATTSIPTLGTWLLIMMGALLGSIAWWRLARL